MAREMTGGGGVIEVCLQKQIQLSVELYYLANDGKKKY
jgi:hypothetical protein